MIKLFNPSNFFVEEIGVDGTLFELGKEINLGKPEDQILERNYFTHFVLQKREWNTVQALKEISRKLKVSQKRFDFAGTKDRQSTSVQLCSAFAIPPEKILSIKIKDVWINGAWKAREKIRLGDLMGNRFTIVLEGIKESDLKKVFLIPNFFGEQRFGALRRNSAEVGKLMVKKEFKEAVLNYLCFPEGDERGKEARERLSKEMDFKKALDYFPKHLKYERSLLNHLAIHPNDFIGALRKLPRSLQLLFIHSFQSMLFNKLLEKRISENKLFKIFSGEKYFKANEFGFPDLNQVFTAEEKEVDELNSLLKEGKAFPAGSIIGYQTQLSEEEKELLKEEGISKEDFFMPSMPELSPKGSLRPLLVSLKDFEVLSQEPLKIRFSLPSGAYASVAVKELFKNELIKKV